MLAADLAVHGTAVLPAGVLADATVLVHDGAVVAAGARDELPPFEAARVIDHDGLVLPGLVDLHDHGGAGVSFPDCADAHEARRAVHEHRRHGTTSLVASLVTASPADLRARVRMLAGLVRTGELVGIHLEGPFISPARKGAQNPQHIAGGDAALAAELCAIAPGTVASMTLAPETEHADAVVEALAAGDAVPSFGHTDCSGAQMEHAIARAGAALSRAGARSRVPTATHLFNGMRPIHHRDPGPALACLDAAARGAMVVEVVGDGVHTAAETVRYVFGVAAPGHVALVTDAMAAAGMADGTYRLGALDVTVRDGVATLTEGGAIAGGTAHLIDVVRFAVREAGVELATAIRAASETPARVLGIAEHVGSISPGLRADLVLTDVDLRVRRVLCEGVELGTGADRKPGARP